MTLIAAARSAGRSRIDPASRGRREGASLTLLLAAYPLWWALGLGVLVIPFVAAVAAVKLVRRRSIAVPPAFGWWLLFLLAVTLSLANLGVDPPGTVAETWLSSLPGATFRLRVLLLLHPHRPVGVQPHRRRHAHAREAHPAARVAVRRHRRGRAARHLRRGTSSSPPRWRCCCRQSVAKTASSSPWCTRPRPRPWTSSATRRRARPRPGATPTPGATTSALTAVWFVVAAFGTPAKTNGASARPSPARGLARARRRTR